MLWYTITKYDLERHMIIYDDVVVNVDELTYLTSSCARMVLWC